MRGIVAVVGLLFAFLAEGQNLSFVLMPAKLVVDPQTNTASGVVVIENSGSQSADVLLLADDFVAEGRAEGLGAKVLFGVNDETPSKTELPLKIGPAERVRVRMDVSGLGHAGIARSRLMDFTREVAKLEALRVQLPFNVAPAGAKGEAPVPLRFEGDAGARMTLKNEDGYAYFVRWSLSAENCPPKESGPPVQIFGQSTLSVDIPTTDWRPKRRDLGALLKTHESSGTLHLMATDETGKRIWKTRDIPVNVQRTHWSRRMEAAWSFALLALLVGLGGAASIIVTHWVPNRLRRIAVRDLILGITPKIRALSTAVDSNLRTGVRVERTRLLQRLRSRSAISPDFGALAKDCEDAGRRLDREIEVLDRIDSKMRHIETKWPFAGMHGPTLLKRACTLLADAQLSLDRPEINDDVVNAASSLLQKAETTIENASSVDEASKTAIKTRLADLLAAPQFVTCAVAKRITENVPGLAAALKMSPDDLSDVNFYRYDEATTKLEFVARFAELCEKETDSPAKTNCIDQFIAALRRGGFNDFRTAEGLTAQMRESVFTEEVAAAIHEGKYQIEIEPQAPKVNQAVSFRIVFHDPNIDTAAARQSIGCTWKFHHPPAPEDLRWTVRTARKIRDLALRARRRQPAKAEWQILTEKGLAVSHYFPTAGTFEVTAEFRDDHGMELKSEPPIAKEVIVVGERLGVFGEHTKIEYSRLAVVLAITVAGLLVGARDELAKLDLIPGIIAVFMLGFTADQIKNILAPPAPK